LIERYTGKPGVSVGAVSLLGDLIVGNKIKGIIEDIGLSAGGLDVGFLDEGYFYSFFAL